MDELPDRCHVEAWAPRVPWIREVFHARLVDYAYPPHCHETWAVLIVDDGAIRYDLDRRALLDRSVPHLVRSFTRQFGLSPHAYVIGRRIDAARQLMLQGAASADVATAVGFYDQAHFTRHFKRHMATTPASYARSHTRRARAY